MSTVVSSSSTSQPLLASWQSKFQNDNDEDVEEGEVDDGEVVTTALEPVIVPDQRGRGLAGGVSRSKGWNKAPQQQPNRKRPRSPSSGGTGGTDLPDRRLDSSLSFSKVPQSEPSKSALNSTTTNTTTPRSFRKKEGGSLPPRLLDSPLSSRRIHRHDDRSQRTTTTTTSSSSHPRSQQRPSPPLQQVVDDNNKKTRGSTVSRSDLDSPPSSSNHPFSLQQKRQQQQQHDRSKAALPAADREALIGVNSRDKRGVERAFQEPLAVVPRGEQRHSHPQGVDKTEVGSRSSDRPSQQQPQHLHNNNHSKEDTISNKPPEMCLHWEPQRLQPQQPPPRDRRSPSESSFHRTSNDQEPKPPPQRQQPFTTLATHSRYPQPAHYNNANGLNHARRSSLEASRSFGPYYSRGRGGGQVEAGPTSKLAPQDVRASAHSSNKGLDPTTVRQAPINRDQPCSQWVPKMSRHNLEQPRNGFSYGRSPPPPSYNSAYRPDGRRRSRERDDALSRQQERAPDPSRSRHDSDTSLPAYRRRSTSPPPRTDGNHQPLRSSWRNPRDVHCETEQRRRSLSPPYFSRYDDRGGPWQRENNLPPPPSLRVSQSKEPPISRSDDRGSSTNETFLVRGSAGRPRSRSPSASSSSLWRHGKRRSWDESEHGHVRLEMGHSLPSTSRWENHHQDEAQPRPRSRSPSTSSHRPYYARKSSWEDTRNNVAPHRRWQSSPPSRFEDGPRLPTQSSSNTNNWRHEEKQSRESTTEEGDTFTSSLANSLHESDAKRNASYPDTLSSGMLRREDRATMLSSLATTESYSIRSPSTLQDKKRLCEIDGKHTMKNDRKDLPNLSPPTHSQTSQHRTTVEQERQRERESSASQSLASPRLGSRWCPPVSPAVSEKKVVSVGTLPPSKIASPLFHVKKTFQSSRFDIDKDNGTDSLENEECVPRSPSAPIVHRWVPPQALSSQAGLSSGSSPPGRNNRNGPSSNDYCGDGPAGETSTSDAKDGLSSSPAISKAPFPASTSKLPVTGVSSSKPTVLACTEQNKCANGSLSKGPTSSSLVVITKTQGPSAGSTSVAAPSKPTVLKKKVTPKSSLGIPMKWLKPAARPPKKKTKTVEKDPSKTGTKIAVATKIMRKEIKEPHSTREDVLQTPAAIEEVGDTLARPLVNRKAEKESVVKQSQKPMKKRMVNEDMAPSSGFSTSAGDEKNDWEVTSSFYEEGLERSGPPKKRAKKLKKLQRTRSPSPLGNANHRTVTDSEGGSTVSSINRDKGSLSMDHQNAMDLAGATPDLTVDNSLTSSLDFADRTHATCVPAVIVPLKEVATTTNADDDDMLMGSPEHHSDGTDSISIKKQRQQRGRSVGVRQAFSSSSSDDDDDSSSDSDDDSDTDEEEVMMWASRMFGISPAPPPIARPKAKKAPTPGGSANKSTTSTTVRKIAAEKTNLQIRLSIPKLPAKKETRPDMEAAQNGEAKATTTAEVNTEECIGERMSKERRLKKLKKKKNKKKDHDAEPVVEEKTDNVADQSRLEHKAERKKNKKMKKKLRKMLTEKKHLQPVEDEEPVDEGAMEREMIEDRRKREEAKILTAAQIQAILGDDWNGGGRGGGNWVRRSTRQPLASFLNSKQMQNFLLKLRTNDPDMVVLKMKKYIADPNVPQVVMNAALEALEENTNCEALYIQNFNNGMKDDQVLHLLRILQQPKCRIWNLNIGETYNVSDETWEAFTIGLKRTKVTHMYASEHTITGEMKDEIRETIRQNRSKHDMHNNPNNLDVIVQCTHCWWNPINAKSLRPYIRNGGYESLLHDKEAQGLKGSMSVVPDTVVPEK